MATNPTLLENYTPSSTNIFVRYLPREVDDVRLREIFSQYGAIASSMVMRDIHSGQSLGTAFVRFSTHAEASLALQEAHGMPLFGKTLSLQWAKQQHDGTPAGQERLRMNKLFLRNVPLDATTEDLKTLVCVCGEVLKVTLHSDTTPVEEVSLVRRIAFITFADYGAAERALQCVHNTLPFRGCDGVPLMAKLSEDYRQRERTPLTPSVAVPPRTPHTPGYSLSGHRGLGGSARSGGSCSAAVTPHYDMSMSTATSQTVTQTPCFVDTPRSIGAGSVRTNYLGGMEVHSVPSTPLGGTVTDTDYAAAPLRTRERKVLPRTISAADGGLTVTIKKRSSAYA